MNRKIITLTMCILSIFSSIKAQNTLNYESFSVGGNDTSHVVVLCSQNKLAISSADAPSGKPIPGTAAHITFVDYALDTAFYQLSFSENEKYFTGFSLKNANEYTFEKTENVNGYSCKKYSTSLFSNKIEIWVTEDLKFRATPSSSFANLPGVLVKMLRNGNYVTNLVSVKKSKKNVDLIPENLGKYTESRTLSNIEKEKLIISIPVFDNEQICFNPKLPKPTSISYDTTLRFSNGTIILKRLKISEIPAHYKIFAEISERSNGDAYDRTGSIFVIPTSSAISFADALLNGVEKLPVFADKKGNEYQGIALTNDYFPLVELVRFFTPFGVSHFNEYRSVSGIEWDDVAYYKQDISDLRDFLSGDVLVGAFIGNYDGGGHKLSLDIKAYPESTEWNLDENAKSWTLPIFNTCNVMEMSGQNYGRFFSTDSLSVTFSVPAGLKSLKLRYITTGHGGWDTGDEFVPKENTIIVDGQPLFKFTPWRSDCGTFRSLNPASGNFWNGMSSSDYSRSGWCPGTATQPVYFDLSDLSAGKHTITIAIPQGVDEGNYFSAWNVSGVLIGEFR